MFTNYVVSTPLNADDAAAAIAQLQRDENLDVHIATGVVMMLILIAWKLLSNRQTAINALR